MKVTKKILRCGFDLDGTLFSIKLMLQRFNEVTGKRIEFSQLNNYSLADVFKISDQQEYDIFSRIKTDINLHSKPLKKTANLVRRLSRQGIEIDIITARRESAMEETKTALKESGIVFDKIFINQPDKYNVIRDLNLTRYFDDQGQLIERLMKTDVADFCELTLIDAPYNQKFSCHSRFYV